MSTSNTFLLFSNQLAAFIMNSLTVATASVLMLLLLSMDASRAAPSDLTSQLASGAKGAIDSTKDAVDAAEASITQTATEVAQGASDTLAGAQESADDAAAQVQKAADDFLKQVDQAAKDVAAALADFFKGRK